MSIRIVVMGVSGSGKSSVGAMLATRLGCEFIDADDLHPSVNVAKMMRGEPLSDADRWPWLDRVAQALAASPIVVGCSALKRAYRERLRARTEGLVTLVHLSGTPEIIAARMAARIDHFMPPSLLASQFATLEPPGPEEDAIVMDIARPLELVVGDIVQILKGRQQ